MGEMTREKSDSFRSRYPADADEPSLRSALQELINDGQVPSDLLDSSDRLNWWTKGFVDWFENEQGFESRGSDWQSRLYEMAREHVRREGL